MADFYVPVLTLSGQWMEANLTIEGMKCQSCVNKIKQIIYQHEPGACVRVNLLNKSINLRFPRQPEQLETLLGALSGEGFVAVPYRDKAFRQELAQIAVSAYAAGNIMLMATAEYFHPVDEPFYTIFRQICMILTAFSLTFAAIPIWQTAVKGLVNRKFETDTGVLLGISAAFLYSSVNVLRGSGEVYFDSVSMVIFLILTGRFFRNRALSKAAENVESQSHVDPEFCLLKTETNQEIVPVTRVRKGDILFVRPGDLVPVNSVVRSGSGYTDLSSMTGEVEKKWVSNGSEIPSGAFSIDGFLELCSLEDGSQGFFTRAASVGADLVTRQGRWQNQSNVIASWFVRVLLGCVLAVIFLKAGGSLEESIRRSVALLLVACPCALGFGIPLIYSKAVSRLQKSDVAVRNLKGLEQLDSCRSIVFDKTGTLTQQDMEVSSLMIHSGPKLSLEFAKVIGNYSGHHVPRILSKWAAQNQEAQKTGLLELEQVSEIPGQGIRARVGGQSFLFGRKAFACPACKHPGQVHLSSDGSCLLSFDLSESLAPDICSAIAFLKSRHFRLLILSGDQKQRTLALADKLGLEASNVLSGQSPDDKLRYVLGKKYMMVGNGINDMLAFSASRVSIAVHASQDLARNKADFYLQRPGLQGLRAIIETGCGTRKALRHLFAFSLLYNLGALSAAAAGYVNPLVAAILMPISSLCTIRIATAWR